MKALLIFALVAGLALPALACPKGGANSVNVNVQAAQAAQAQIGLAQVGVVQAATTVPLTFRQRRLLARQVTRNAQIVVGTPVAVQTQVVAQPVAVAPPPPPAPVPAVPQALLARPKRYQLVEVPPQDEEPAPEDAKAEAQAQRAPQIHSFELVETDAQVPTLALAQPVYQSYQYLQTMVPTFATVTASPVFTSLATVAVQPTASAIVTTGANVALAGRGRILGGRHKTTVTTTPRGVRVRSR